MMLNAVVKRGETDHAKVSQHALAWRESLGEELRAVTWDYLPTVQLPRQLDDVMVERCVRETLFRRSFSRNCG